MQPKGVVTNTHLFWTTQPVSQNEVALRASEVTVGPIDTPKTVADIPTEPYPLASTLEWYSPNLENDADMQALYELLRDNYVEDGEALFRFNYSIPFLRWAMTPPGYYHDWHVAVRKKSDGKLLAFISGIPLRITMGEPGQSATATNATALLSTAEPRKVCEINFLCVHKVLRQKKLAPLLIREVTRRVNLRDIWQAVYTAGVKLPTPFATAQYHHRALNPLKLIDVRFSRMPRAFEKFNNPGAALNRHFAVPAVPKMPGIRPMTPNDVDAVWKLLQSHLKEYPVGLHIDGREAAAHWLLPRKGVVFSYVVPGNEPNSILAFTSFYSLPSSIVGNTKHPLLNAVYSYYYASVRKGNSEEWMFPPSVLFSDAITFAKKEGFDVFNTVDVLRNGVAMNDLKFAPGDGHLHYYFYNWSLPALTPADIGLVML